MRYPSPSWAAISSDIACNKPRSTTTCPQVVVDLGLLHAISESLLGCDQLGRYHGCPGGAEADAHPDQDERCRSRDDDTHEDGAVLGEIGRASCRERGALGGAVAGSDEGRS